MHAKRCERSGGRRVPSWVALAVLVNCGDLSTAELFSLLAEQTVVVGARRPAEAGTGSPDPFAEEHYRERHEQGLADWEFAKKYGGEKSVIPPRSHPFENQGGATGARDQGPQVDLESARAAEAQRRNRMGAIRCLGNRPADEVLPQLKRVFWSIDDRDLLSPIAKVISGLGADGVDFLAAEVRRGEERNRIAALDALAPVQAREITAEVAPLIVGSSQGLRIAAEAYLSAQPMDHVRETIVELLEGRTCESIDAGIGLLERKAGSDVARLLAEDAELRGSVDEVVESGTCEGAKKAKRILPAVYLREDLVGALQERDFARQYEAVQKLRQLAIDRENHREQEGIDLKALLHANDDELLDLLEEFADSRQFPNDGMKATARQVLLWCQQVR